MSDDQAQHPDTTNKKGFFSQLRDHLFHNELKNRDDLVDLIRDAEQHDLINPDTRQMLEGVINITECRVRDIMIPRSQMVTLHKDQSLADCVAITIESAHSRYPVVSDDKDHIEGILLAKDLLLFINRDPEQFSISDILRPVIIVPESKRVDKMLQEFRTQRYHMAIIVDEFGGVSGLVTIEDILELIVGEIDDEYDEVDQFTVRKVAKDRYTLPALMPIELFNATFHTQFSDDDVDTIGGLILQSIGHLPTRGETVTLDHYQFKVTLADSRRIIQLQVKTPDNALAPTLTLE